MSALNAIYCIWCDIAARWRAWQPSGPGREAPPQRDDADDDERDALAREKERIELAILRAHFHF